MSCLDDLGELALNFIIFLTYISHKMSGINVSPLASEIFNHLCILTPSKKILVIMKIVNNLTDQMFWQVHKYCSTTGSNSQSFNLTLYSVTYQSRIVDFKIFEYCCFRLGRTESLGYRYIKSLFKGRNNYQWLKHISWLNLKSYQSSQECQSEYIDDILDVY